MGDFPSAALRKSDVSDLLDHDAAPHHFLKEVHDLATAVSNGKSRTYDDAILKCMRGLAAEYAFTRQFPQFCRSGLGFYDYDVSFLSDKPGTRIEIKCPLTDKDWWVPVNYGQFYSAVDRGKVDYICNTYLNEETGILHIKAVANAKSFERYMSLGPYNHYYNHFRAVNDNECWTGPDAKIKINEIIKEHSWKSF